MNKTLKRILIGFAVVIGLFILTAVGFGLKMKSEVKNMHVIETKELVQHVFAVKNSFVNMFLLKDSDNYIAIDAGADEKVIKEELKKLKIDTAKVIAVFLTHGDGDHTAALSVFSNAKVYLSRDEEQMINGKTAKMMFMHNSISRKDYNLVDDGQKITIAKTLITCISTPGHTPGSMSYLLNDTYLFVGDAFGLKDGKVDKPNSIFSKDMPLAIQSFQKINNLPTAEYIFTAHSGFTSDYKNAVKTVLK
ncbi:MAG: MBL fold metallo-hydrolase [Paludibacter sp.]|jgi:hydroxyacylglutathione hydrolase